MDRIRSADANARLAWALPALLVSMSLSLCVRAAEPDDAKALGVTLKPLPEFAFPARPSQRLICPRASAAPVLDGKLDDVCWKNAAEAKDFLIYASRVPAGQKTRVLVTFDDNNIYLGYVCQEAEMAKLQLNTRAELREGDNDCVWKNDCIELFLDPQLACRDCYQFEVDAVGQKWDALIRATFARNFATPRLAEEPTWDSGLKTAVAKNADGWTAEVSVPAAGMGIEKILDGAVWGVNFTRNERPHSELSTWVPWEYNCNFSTAMFLGTLVFGDSPWLLEEVDLGLPARGTNRLTAQINRNLDAQADLELRLELVPANGKAEVFSEKAHFAAGERKGVPLSYRIPAGADRVKMVLSLIDPQDNRLIARRSYEFGVAAGLLELRARNRTAYCGAADMLFELNVNLGRVSRETGRLEVSLMRGKELIRRGIIRGPFNTENQLLLKTVGLSTGEYVFSAKLVADEDTLTAESKIRLSLVNDPFNW